MLNLKNLLLAERASLCGFTFGSCDSLDLPRRKDSTYSIGDDFD